MKTRHIATVFAAALFTVGLIPLGSASEVGGFPEGIEVITVVGKRTDPTIARACVNTALADAAESHATRDSVRQRIKECIDRAQLEANHS